MANAFSETRNLFIIHTGYTKPLTYEQWESTHDDDKAAVLFVQFYEQITLAWYKTKSFFALEEDGVSTVLQYLVKNVPVILKNPKRFSASYIYKVAYNCLYCISHDIKRDIDRYENETSNIVMSGDTELDLFDTVSNKIDFDEKSMEEEFWAVIEDSGLSTMKVVEHILNETPLKKNKLHPSVLKNVAILHDADKLAQELSKKKTAADKKEYMARLTSAEIKQNNYNIDPLRDIEVSVSEAEEIIEQLKSKLAKFKKYYNM